MPERVMINWKECTLGDIVTLQRGFDLPEKGRQKGSVPIVSSSGVTGYHNVAKVKGPGVVTGRYGTLGEVFFLKESFWPLNTTLFVRDFKGNDPIFVSYFLRTLDLARQNSAGAVPGVNRNALHLLPVCVPFPPIQRKIASILSAYDDLIENSTHRIAILEQMARMLYKEWFVKFRFPEYEQVRMVESELGMIPEGWEVKPFSKLVDVLSGGTPKTSVSEYWHGNIPFFTPRDAPASFYVCNTEKHITDVGLSSCNSRLHPKNTVFITARGTVGKVALSAVAMAMNQSCYALKGREDIGQLFLLLHTEHFVDYLKQMVSGAVFDTIIVDTFKSIQVIKPPLSLIERFCVRVVPIFDQILNLLRKNANLRRTRDLLLPKLISGEIDVSSWADGLLEAEEIVAVMARERGEGREEMLGPPIDADSLEQRSLWE